MTKRVVIAVILFFAALSGSVSANIYTISAFEDMKTVISQSEENAEKAKELLEIWEKNKVALSVLLKHADADRIERYFELLEIYGGGENHTMLNTVFFELEAFIEVTEQGEKLKLENIF